MAMESPKNFADPEEPSSETRDTTEHRSPSRRHFLKVGGKFAIGAMAAISGQSENPDILKETRKSKESTLTETILRGEIIELQRQYPTTWERVIRNKVEKTAGLVASAFESHDRRKKIKTHGKVGAGLGLAGIDIVSRYPGWRLHAADERRTEPSQSSDKPQEELEHPFQSIALHLLALGERHLKRTVIAGISGGLTMVVSSLLTPRTRKDPEIRAYAVEIANDTLIPDSSPPSEDLAKFRKEMFEYVLGMTRHIQPWLEASSIRDPIEKWGAGSYMAAKEIASYGQHEESGEKFKE